MDYKEWKEKRQAEIDALPIRFAFSNKQFEELCSYFGITEEEAPEKLYSFGYGGFHLKTDSSLIYGTLKRWSGEEDRLMKEDDEFALSAIRYELANHEYCISYDNETVLEALGLSLSDIKEDERLRRLWKQAKREYLQSVDYEIC